MKVDYNRDHVHIQCVMCIQCGQSECEHLFRVLNMSGSFVIKSFWVQIDILSLLETNGDGWVDYNVSALSLGLLCRNF